MLPTATSRLYHSDTVSNMPKNSTNALFLQISRKDAERVVALLIGQSISFELCFPQTTPPEVSEALPAAELLPRIEGPQMVKPMVLKALKTVYKKYIENAHIPTPNVTAVAREAGMCAKTFKINFHKLFQKSFMQAHLEKRMEHAAGLLQEGYSCKEVTCMVGYAEKSAIKFNKMFQRHYGMSPKKYQLEKIGIRLK